MNKNILLSSFVIFLSCPVLTCCSGEANISNLKDAVNYVTKKKNFTLSYVSSSNNHEFIFTDKSIGVISEEYPYIDDIHIQDKNGVYRLRYNNDKFIAGELSPLGDSLWDDGFRNTLYKASNSFVSDIGDKTSYTVKDKDFKLKYSLTIGYTVEQYANIDSLTLSYYVKDEKPYLRFSLIYLGNEIIYDAHHFGNSENKVVDDFLSKGGKPLEIDDELASTRDLIKGNNFIQPSYYFGEEESGYIGESYFNPHYYMFAYYSGGFGYGAISLNSSEYNLRGCYYFTLDTSTPGATPSLLNRPLYEEPDVVEYYHYPSYLALWNNLEYLTKWTNQDMGGYTKTGKGYYLTNTSLLNDFAYNFSISDNFEGQRPLALAIDYTTLEGERIIYFYYKFSLQGYIYVLPIPLYGFGKANIPILDQVYDAFND